MSRNLHKICAYECFELAVWIKIVN